MITSEVANTTTYSLFPLVLNATYEVIVSGINGAGEGNSSELLLSFSNGIN